MNTNRSNVRTLRRPASSAPSAGRRLRANWRAEFRGQGFRAACTVVDVSSAGACLTLDYIPDTKAPLWLIIDKLPPIPASVAWRRKNHTGLRFRHEQQWVLDACKQRFDAAAWVKESNG